MTRAPKGTLAICACGGCDKDLPRGRAGLCDVCGVAGCRAGQPCRRGRAETRVYTAKHETTPAAFTPELLDHLEGDVARLLQGVLAVDEAAAAPEAQAQWRIACMHLEIARSHMELSRLAQTRAVAAGPGRTS